MTTSTPPAVLGAALYRGPDDVDMFLRSFEANRRSARLYLLVDRVDFEAWLPVRSASVELVPIRRPWLLRAPVGRSEYRLRRALAMLGLGRLIRAFDRVLIAADRRPVGPLLEQPHVARFWHQLGVVERELRGAPWVFVTDVRDVAFQGDFEQTFDELAAQAPLHVFAEGVELGEPGDLAGAPQIRELRRAVPTGAHPLLCVGTVLGRPDAAAALLRRLLAVMSLPFGRFPRTIDQGALNLLVHTGAVADLEPKVHPPGDGGVLTCALVEDRPELVVGDSGVFWQSLFPPVVHQFDRVAGLEAVYESRFA
jgi:hypothetical protein